MSGRDSHAKSFLQDETELRWGFLEEELEACAVVSTRMELVYINGAGRTLMPEEWFGKRCFEVLPVADETCALHCPTIKAVNESTEIVFCRETVRGAEGGPERRFGVGMIPLPERGTDPARAVFLFRQEEEGADDVAFQMDLLDAAARLRDRILAHLPPGTG